LYISSINFYSAIFRYNIYALQTQYSSAINCQAWINVVTNKDYFLARFAFNQGIPANGKNGVSTLMVNGPPVSCTYGTAGNLNIT
jgi:hypothetical protein